MAIDSAHIILFSPCGGTANVTRALVRELDLPVYEHDLTLPDKRVEMLAFSPNDLVFLGFPVYGGHMPKNLSQIFSNLDGGSAPCAIVAVYGNRAYEGALLDLYGAATLKNFNPVAAVAGVAEHSMASHIATDRPDNEDKSNLAEFGKKILEQAIQGKRLEKAPGAYPEWKVPDGAHLYPITDMDTCVGCGKCAEVCPTGAIPADAPHHTNIDHCIMCAACVKYCPHNARMSGTPQTREMFKPHLEAAMTRKDAELFI